nr:vegetative cell wall protein gp1-like [Aegilops tauschii subsp. strangulata]
MPAASRYALTVRPALPLPAAHLATLPRRTAASRPWPWPHPACTPWPCPPCLTSPPLRGRAPSRFTARSRAPGARLAPLRSRPSARPAPVELRPAPSPSQLAPPTTAVGACHSLWPLLPRHPASTAAHRAAPLLAVAPPWPRPRPPQPPPLAARRLPVPRRPCCAVPARGPGPLRRCGCSSLRPSAPSAVFLPVDEGRTPNAR